MERKRVASAAVPLEKAKRLRAKSDRLNFIDPDEEPKIFD